MAQYRLSAQMIGRSQGRSATAAAAYRSASRVVDHETGLVHDYRKKGGVLHTEIITPDGTPDWMTDRAQLWNAVHTAETRKNSQLARELQLSLPHELNEEQNAGLVRRFVTENCVSRGMIADIAIHAPSSDPAASALNIHAHVMLTTREFVGDDWAKNKNRDWHKTEMIEQWRENWANAINREMERIGSSERVSHLSLADQGILREPQKHLGPRASQMEREGVSSHRGNENRAIKARNGLLNDITAHGNMLDAKIAFEKRKFAVWQEAKRGKLRTERDARAKALDKKLAKDMATFEASLDAEIGQTRRGISRQHEQVAGRLQVRGWRKFIRDITLTTAKDKTELDRLEYERARLQAQEDRKRDIQKSKQDSQRSIRAAEEMRKANLFEKVMQKAEERRQAEGWAMKPGKGVLGTPAPDPSPAEPKPKKRTSDPLPERTRKYPPPRQTRGHPDLPQMRSALKKEEIREERASRRSKMNRTGLSGKFNEQDDGQDI